MKKIVFKQPPTLSAQERRIADMHSFLNILNVLACEISVIEMELDGEQATTFVHFGDEIAAIAQSLKEDDDISQALARLRASEAQLVSAVCAVLQQVGDVALVADIEESLANIESVYRIVRKRVEEMEARLEDPDVWISMLVSDFESQFQEVFFAIEKNSKGRYRIYFNLARKTQADYYIDLKIESALQADLVWIPMRLIDVIRDLTANARKYTKPGGKVALAVYQSAQEIQVLIEDSGCGIPEEELEHVVEFGYRATNVRARRTMGGGFGLTKAAWLIHHWGGSLSIESGVGEGTIVRLTVPNQSLPKNALSAPDFTI